MHASKNQKGFTLLELLIVIGIISILAVVVIFVLNPAETLKKARDSQRMADLNTLKTAIGLYLTSTSTPTLGASGNSNTGCMPGTKYVWYSKAGVSGTVDSGTATPPSSQAAAANTDGTGWVPVNLNSLTGGSPISNLPIDPVNSVGTLSAPVNGDLVYRYGCSTTSMQFELNATLESNAYTVSDNKYTSDGGNNSNLYEVGTNLTILGNGSF